MTILTAFYTANLTAYLTLSKVPIPFDNLKKVGFRTYWIARKGDTIEAIVKSAETKGANYVGWGKVRNKKDAWLLIDAKGIDQCLGQQLVPGIR